MSVVLVAHSIFWFLVQNAMLKTIKHICTHCWYEIIDFGDIDHLVSSLKQLFKILGFQENTFKNYKS